jgi:thiol-disulfide isomerase/thioredoxin
MGVMGYAQSFYVLSGVDSYRILVADMSKKTEKYNGDIEKLMQGISKELGVVTSHKDSRVLALLVSDVSMGDVIGLKIELELGEYVMRKGDTQNIFALTYMDTKLIAPDFKDEEDVEDQLADTIEEMLESFKLQHIEDNKNQSSLSKTVTHETFASDMGYETEYKIALAKAKKEKKPLMIFMTTSYCPWCRKLENRVLSQSKIDEKIKEKYIPLMLNLDTSTYPKQFAKTRFTPILYIVESHDEKILHQFVGYNNRNGFLRLLK